MTGFFRSLLPFALSLLVAFTGLGIAESRGIDRAVGQMVLCTGSGPVVVYMDEDGQPTRAPHYCPDYALSLLGAVHQAQIDVPLAPPLTQPVFLRRSESQISAPLPQRPARAPPVTA
ncbi:hypothetical protein RA27_08770 [Ruegeria sp. ANG-R]|uniref:hypothetical protein n=1 Tax=Ruegeria sp. ANG-R TaxID=1577903 RepID=UPI00057CFCA4|nr:hypothetical protein [Ruegeria sp. ANG-R]KIC43352.1 hypothetical protein RA27_08770 [Ruegeria sp. ANG-R]